MNEEHKANAANDETTFSRQVGAQAARKLKAQRVAPTSVWFGLGMSGLVGWSVTIPTLIGAALGIWVDKHYPSSLFLDADAASHGFDHRLSQCLALGPTRNTRKCRRIRMSDILALALALVAGALLGAFFFGGLWWTVQKGVTSETPALWFLGSLLLRTGLDSGWILSCFAGSLVKARGVPPWISDRALHRREAAHTSAGGRADSTGRGDQHCALLPMTWFSGGTALSSSIARSSRPGY